MRAFRSRQARLSTCSVQHQATPPPTGLQKPVACLYRLYDSYTHCSNVLLYISAVCSHHDSFHQFAGALHAVAAMTGLSWTHEHVEKHDQDFANKAHMTRKALCSSYRASSLPAVLETAKFEPLTVRLAAALLVQFTATTVGSLQPCASLIARAHCTPLATSQARSTAFLGSSES